MHRPQLYGQHKKTPFYGTILNLSNILTSFFKRSQFCFKLDTLVVVEINVLTYEEASLLICLQFHPIDALRFQN